MLIINTDLIGKMSIPNFGDKSPLSNKLGTDDFITSILKDEVKTELLSLLGWELYERVEDNLSKNFEDRFKTDPDAEIVKLLEGHQGYRGLIKPISDFIYYNYLEETNSFLTSAGNKTLNSKTGAKYNSREKSVKYYNEYIKFMYGEGGRSRVFENDLGISIDWSRGSLISVYDYLLENKDLFPNLAIGVRRTELMNNMEI